MWRNAVLLHYFEDSDICPTLLWSTVSSMVVSISSSNVLVPYLLHRTWGSFQGYSKYLGDLLFYFSTITVKSAGSWTIIYSVAWSHGHQLIRIGLSVKWALVYHSYFHLRYIFFCHSFSFYLIF